MSAKVPEKILENVGFIGGGNMAQAIGLGLIKKGMFFYHFMSF